MQNITEIILREQTRALGLLQQMPDRTMKSIGPPVSFDDMRPVLPVRLPKLGERTNEFLKKSEQ